MKKSGYSKCSRRGSTKCVLLWAVALLGLSGSPRAQGLFLNGSGKEIAVDGLPFANNGSVVRDDFDDGVLDSSKWGVLLPFSDSSVVESGGVCQLTNRGTLYDKGVHDLALEGPLAVQCKFRNVFACGGCGTDALYLYSRTDLDTTGQCCGNFLSGISLQVSGTADNANLFQTSDGVL